MTNNTESKSIEHNIINLFAGVGNICVTLNDNIYKKDYIELVELIISNMMDRTILKYPYIQNNNSLLDYYRQEQFTHYDLTYYLNGKKGYSKKLKRIIISFIKFVFKTLASEYTKEKLPEILSFFSNLLNEDDSDNNFYTPCMCII